MARDGLSNQLLGQIGTLAWGNQPAHHETTEDIQNHIQVEIGSLGWAFEFGDIPGPDLVGGLGQQLWLGIGGVCALISALKRCTIERQHTVHGAYRAQVAAFIK